MPALLGQPMYPGGFPLKPQEIKVDGETLDTIFLKYCMNCSSKTEEDILKLFVIYYMKAPLFDLNYLKGVDLSTMSFYELISACLDIGIDPF